MNSDDEDEYPLMAKIHRNFEVQQILHNQYDHCELQIVVEPLPLGF